MKVYIAGKITGDSKYKDKFSDAERYWSERRHSVLNPAMLPPGMQQGDYMWICFAMIDCADVVVFLHDYKQSKGAMLEYAYCQYIGKKTTMHPEPQKGA